MLVQPPLPLARYQAVHTTNVEEAAAIFSRVTTPAHFAKVERGEAFEWRRNALRIGAVQVAADEYGAGFEANTALVEDLFATSFPLVDVEAFGVDAGTTLAVRRDQTTFFASPGRAGGFRIRGGYRALQLSIRRADVESVLAAIVGQPLTSALRLEPVLSLASGVGAWLQRFVRFVVDEASMNDSPFASPLARARLADSFIYGILEQHPHSHTALIARSRTAEPKYVHDAAEYIDAHAAEPLRLADLAQVTGMGVRALQLGFLKHRGCSPMEFLRERRLLLARKRLLETGGQDVLQTALACGFSNAGRFSALYRQRFGESPSATARRRSPGR